MAIYQRLNASVPIFGPNVPRAVRASFVLFLIAWFWELNSSLRMLASMGFTHEPPKPYGALELFFVIWAGWQLFNLVLLAGIAYRRNWARLIELIITVVWILMVATNHRFNPGLFYLGTVAATVLLFVPSADAWFRVSKVQSN